MARRLLQAGGAQLLEAQVEAEAGGVLQDSAGAPGRLAVVHDAAAALLAGRSRLIEQRRLALDVPLVHHLRVKTRCDGLD